MIAAAAAILAVAPVLAMVSLAEILNGLAGGIVISAIGAISLGLVGQRAMSARTGRNYRFAAAGHALTAALMGMAGAYVSDSAIFIAAATLCVPALIALSFIRSDEIDYARARNAARGEGGDKADRVTRARDLIKNRPLLLFAACLVLFQLADASMLPLVGENVARQTASPVAKMAGLIIVPQIVVANSRPLGRLPFRSARSPAASPHRLCDRTRTGSIARDHKFLSGPHSGTIARRHNGCHRHGLDGPGDNRLDHRDRPI